MNDCRVSWLMPVYNGEEFLAEALDSMLAQTFPDFELVVVNDGSTDSTHDILRHYACSDGRVKVIDQPNGGIVSALNRGLRECRGEYIARMDADDISLTHRLEKQVAYLDKHKDCVLVGGRAITRHADGSISRHHPSKYRVLNLRPFPAKVPISLHPLVLMRRSALEKIGGYRSQFIHAEDYDLFIRIGKLGTIDNPLEDMLVYRRHAGAISSKHVVAQERSAALAEEDARLTEGLRQTPAALFEAYVRMRIFRRKLNDDWVDAWTFLPRSLRDLGLAIAMLSPNLAMRIGYNIVRFARGVSRQYEGGGTITGR